MQKKMKRQGDLKIQIELWLCELKKGSNLENLKEFGSKKFQWINRLESRIFHYSKILKLWKNKALEDKATTKK